MDTRSANAGAAQAEHEPRRTSVALIVNTQSRAGEHQYERVVRGLQQAGVNLLSARRAEKPDEVDAALTEALAHRAPIVAVGGGDGTLRCTAGRLKGLDTALGVLPLGTVNDFARNLGIEPSIEAACRVIAGGNTERIDLGLANDEVFTITASLGFSAQAQRALTPGLKRALGPLAYAAASLRALSRLRHLSVTLHCAERQETLRAVQVGAVNGHSWIGGRCEIPGIDLQAGAMAVYAVRPQPRLAYFTAALSLVRGHFFSTPGLLAFTTQEVEINTSRPQPLVLDGDLCGETPVRLRLLRAALKVCVPTAEPGS